MFALLGFPSVREEEKRLKPLVHKLRAMRISPPTDVRRCISNLVSKFYNDPTVNKFEIVVLL